MYEQFVGLAFEIAKQSPTIFLLGLIAWDYRKREAVAMEKLDKLSKAHKKELKEVREDHARQLDKNNEYMREDRKDSDEILNSVQVSLEAVKMYISNNTK